jgi:hypothetical protein
MNTNRTLYGNISADTDHPSRGAILTIDSAQRHGGENIPLSSRADVEAAIAQTFSAARPVPPSSF